MALPGTSKSFEQFRRDDSDCRTYAQSQIAPGTVEQADINSGLASAAVGTALGAVAGAAIGGHHAAGYGAATGLAVGSLAGINTAQVSSGSYQRHYDAAYMQCMYAKGERIPASAGMAGGQVPSQYVPGPTYGMPPPPGYSPPAGY
jgi:hypothetical protein